MYPEYARDAMTDWVVGHREEDFSLDVDHAVAVIARAPPDACVLLPSPEQPDGHGAAARHRRRGLRRRGRDGGVVVVDEAYAEFRRAGTPSALELLPQTPNLVVSRTMSKAFALAGARLGYLAASTGDHRRDPRRCGCPTTCPP